MNMSAGSPGKPCLVHADATKHVQIFTMCNCKFAMEKSKENTGRMVVFNEIGVKQAYTLEASYFRSVPDETTKPDTKITVPI